MSARLRELAMLPVLVLWVGVVLGLMYGDLRIAFYALLAAMLCTAAVFTDQRYFTPLAGAALLLTLFSLTFGDLPQLIWVAFLIQFWALLSGRELLYRMSKVTGNAGKGWMKVHLLGLMPLTMTFVLTAIISFMMIMLIPALEFGNWSVLELGSVAFIALLGAAYLLLTGRPVEQK